MRTTSIIGVIAILCAVWVIYDVWNNQHKMKGDEKILWTVLAILFSVIVAIIYYIVKKK